MNVGLVENTGFLDPAAALSLPLRSIVALRVAGTRDPREPLQQGYNLGFLLLWHNSRLSRRRGKTSYEVLCSPLKAASLEQVVFFISLPEFLYFQGNTFIPSSPAQAVSCCLLNTFTFFLSWVKLHDFCHEKKESKVKKAFTLFL